MTMTRSLSGLSLHEGTRLSVDGQYLVAYRIIAALLLLNLFAIAYSK